MLLQILLGVATISTASSYVFIREECLNYTVYPVQYDLVIRPHEYRENTFYYDGEVTITVIANVAGVTVIELDALYLDIPKDGITVLSGNTNIIDVRRPFEYDEVRGKINVYLKEELIPYRVQQNQYRIIIIFRKYVTQRHHGIFVSKYTENHSNRYVFVTRLSPDQARTMFPCFDNPQFESVYRIRVYLPASRVTRDKLIGDTCLVVAPVSRSYTTTDGYIVVDYMPSPQIASYQVGLHISYYVNEKTTVSSTNDTLIVWAEAAKIRQCDYIMILGRNLINVIHNYTLTKIPITQGPINLVTIPEYFVNGYEIDSWNLLTNGDHRITYSMHYTSVEQKERMSFELAQQLSRIWLGNPGEIARTRWREHWFKEGMATYFAYYLLSEAHSFWNMRTYGLQNRMRAMYIEQWESPPLGYFNKTLGIHLTPRDLELVSIRAAALLWMVENWIGSDVFHNALQFYIESRRGKYISLDDFALFLQTETVLCEHFTGYTVSDFLNSWINQPGYPIVKVNVFNNTGSEQVVKLEQKHFAFNNNLRKEYKYIIPVSYNTEHSEHCYNCFRSKFTIGDTVYSFKENLNSGWIILNRNASGLYRVNYDSETWKRIIQTLKGPKRTTIHTDNRAQIVNDAFALYIAGEIDYELAMDILDCLDNESDFEVWDAAFEGFELLKIDGAAVFMSKQLFNTWKKFMRDKVSSLYNRMEDHIETDDQTKVFRSKMMRFACQLEHEKCLRAIQPTLRKIRLREKYDPNLRETCYYTLQNSTFIQQWQTMKGTMNNYEMEDALAAQERLYDPNLRETCYYTLQNSTFIQQWQTMKGTMNNYEMEDALAAQERFARNELYEANLRSATDAPMNYYAPPATILQHTTQVIEVHTTRKPSSAVTREVAILSFILCILCTTIIR